MATKIKDLAVKTGEYTDRDGNTKGRYENIGVIMQKDDGGKFMMLKRTFNAAGVPNPDNRDTVLVSMFDPRGNDGQQQQQPSQHQQAKQNGYQTQPTDDGDDVPF